MIVHFYHVWADGKWEDPVREHAEAIRDSGFPEPPIVGLVGSARARSEAGAYCRELMGSTRHIVADQGWEHVTLRAVRDHAIAHPNDVVLYAHSKGAHHPNPLNTALRRSTTYHLVWGWTSCVNALNDHDAVGCHWLTPEQYPVRTPYFAGNYWWATGHHLARLPDIRDADRYSAEEWIGLVRPRRVLDLRPGWPTWGLFGQEVAQIMNPTTVIL